MRLTKLESSASSTQAIRPQGPIINLSLEEEELATTCPISPIVAECEDFRQAADALPLPSNYDSR